MKKASVFSSRGHYTTSGGIMQEGIVDLQDFFEGSQNVVQILRQKLGLSEHVAEQGVQILLKVLRQDGALLPAEGHEALFAGMRPPVEGIEQIEIGFQKSADPVVYTDQITPAGGLQDLCVIGGHGAAEELAITLHNVLS